VKKSDALGNLPISSLGSCGTGGERIPIGGGPCCVEAKLGSVVAVSAPGEMSSRKPFSAAGSNSAVLPKRPWTSSQSVP